MGDMAWTTAAWIWSMAGMESRQYVGHGSWGHAGWHGGMDHTRWLDMDLSGNGWHGWMAGAMQATPSLRDQQPAGRYANHDTSISWTPGLFARQRPTRPHVL